MNDKTHEKTSAFSALIDSKVKEKIEEIPEEFYHSVPMDILKSYRGNDGVSENLTGNRLSENFLRISLPIAIDSRLRANDKLVFGLIETMLQFYRYAYPSVRYISKVLGITTNTVHRSILKLESLNLIFRLKLSYDKTIYLPVDLDNIYPRLIDKFEVCITGWSIYALFKDVLKDYFNSVRVQNFTSPLERKLSISCDDTSVLKDKERGHIENYLKENNNEEKNKRFVDPQPMVEGSTTKTKESYYSQFPFPVRGEIIREDFALSKPPQTWRHRVEK